MGKYSYFGEGNESPEVGGAFCSCIWSSIHQRRAKCQLKKIDHCLLMILISSSCCSLSICVPMFRTQWSLSARLLVLNTVARPVTPNRVTVRKRCRVRPSSSPPLDLKNDVFLLCHSTKQVVVSSSDDVQPSSKYIRGSAWCPGWLLSKVWFW